MLEHGTIGAEQSTWRALAASSAICSASGTVCGPFRSARSVSLHQVWHEDAAYGGAHELLSIAHSWFSTTA